MITAMVKKKLGDVFCTILKLKWLDPLHWNIEFTVACDGHGEVFNTVQLIQNELKESIPTVWL